LRDGGAAGRSAEQIPRRMSSTHRDIFAFVNR
jgi:hypothetical protein